VPAPVVRLARATPVGEGKQDVKHDWREREKVPWIG
jgi:hypothetical protein